ncbi:g2511 [Coccomyxa elongata]
MEAPSGGTKATLTSRSCMHAAGCSSRSSFNYPEQQGGLFCSKHRLEGMINVRNKPCLHPGCQKQPCFNRPGTTVGLYCGDHRSPDHVNVKQKYCHQAGCEARPSFAAPGAGPGSGRYCSKHKLQGMVDVRNKHCHQEGCNKCPSFNSPGKTVPLFCRAHKKEGMTDVKHRERLPGSAKRVQEANLGRQESTSRMKLPVTSESASTVRPNTPACSSSVPFGNGGQHGPAVEFCAANGLIGSGETPEAASSAAPADRSQAAQCRPNAPPLSQPPADISGLTKPCSELAADNLIEVPRCGGVDAGGGLVQGQPQGSFMQMLVDGAAPVGLT